MQKIDNQPEPTGQGLLITHSYCLICWDRVKKKGPLMNNSNKTEELFQRICSALKADLSTWDFGTESFPFCGSCIKGIQQLICLQDKLKLITKEIDVKIQGIRSKLWESDHKFISTDLRIIGFRSQVLGLGAPIQQQSYFVGNSMQHGIATEYQSIPNLSTSNNSNTFPYSSEHPFQPLRGLSNVQEAFSDFGTHHHSTVPSNSIYHQNIHNSPEDDSNVGLIEIQVGINESNNSLNSEDNSHEILEDINDTDYSPPTINDDETQNTSSRSKMNALSKVSLKQNKSAQQCVKSTNKSKELEYFSPLEKKDGRMFYEDIEISKNEQGYVCGMCGFNKVKGHSSIALRKMKIHMKGVHFGAYKCQICNRSFASGDILNQHTKRIHIIGLIPCEICQKPITGTGNAMKAHRWTHKNESEKKEARALGLEPMEIKYLKTRNKKHVCPTCDKSFVKLHVMKDHMKTHLAPSLRKDIKCPKCDNMFTTRTNLRVHIKYHHEQHKVVRWFHCICGKQFSKKSDHDKHVANKHMPDEEKQFSCSICNKKFGMLLHLKDHLKNHPPIEYYKSQCAICGVRVKNREAILDHRRRHHRQLHLKPKPVKIIIGTGGIKTQKQLPLLADERISEYTPKGQTETEGPRLTKEKFGPIDIGNDGKFYFEGYEVVKLKQGGFSCITCDVEFKKHSDHFAERALKVHIRGLHLGKYVCSYCDRKCESISNLTAHKHKVHFLTMKECETCGMEMDQKKHRVHLWSHKSPDEMIIAINSGEPIPRDFKLLKTSLARKIEESINFNCRDCSEQFPNPIGLDDHRIDCHPETIIKQYRNKLATIAYNRNRIKSKRVKKNNRSRPISRKEEYSSESEATNTSSESGIEDDNFVVQPSIGRALRNRKSKYIKQESISEGPGVSHRPVVNLTSLPNSNGKDIRIISNQLVSYVSGAGKMKLMSLDQDSESSSSNSSDHDFVDQSESSDNCDPEYKLFSDADDRLDVKAVKTNKD